jgi:hypothetical protein
MGLRENLLSLTITKWTSSSLKRREFGNLLFKKSWLNEIPPPLSSE